MPFTDNEMQNPPGVPCPKCGTPMERSSFQFVCCPMDMTHTKLVRCTGNVYRMNLRRAAVMRMRALPVAIRRPGRVAIYEMDGALYRPKRRGQDEREAILARRKDYRNNWVRQWLVPMPKW